MNQTKILFVGNSTGSKLWRILPLAKYLNRTQEFYCDVIESKKLTLEAIMNYDLIVLQMVFDKRIIQEIKKQGKKLIFEMDDLITWVPDDHYAKEDVKKIPWKLNVFYAINKADAITTTNKYLKRYYGWLRPFKKKIYILPNYVDREFWLRDHKPNKGDMVRIGYVGGISHVKDLEYIAEPINKVLKEYDNTEFITMGTGGYSSDNPMTEYNYGKDCFKSIPHSRRTHYLGIEMMAYPDKLYSLSLDIGLAPLIKNKFTKSKTPIKWMEYALNRTPSICQDFLYKDVVKHNVNGFLAKTKDDYYKYLKILIEDKEKRKLMGERAHWDVIQKYLFQKHAEKFKLVYTHILNK